VTGIRRLSGWTSPNCPKPKFYPNFEGVSLALDSWRFAYEELRHWVINRVIKFQVAQLIWPAYINVRPDRQTDRRQITYDCITRPCYSCERRYAGKNYYLYMPGHVLIIMSRVSGDDPCFSTGGKLRRSARVSWRECFIYWCKPRVIMTNRKEFNSSGLSWGYRPISQSINRNAYIWAHCTTAVLLCSQIYRSSPFE